MRVAILGGGLAGIAAAHELACRDIDCDIFEASDRIGGLCRSVKWDGHTFDIGGVHVLQSRHEETLKFMLRLLGPNVHRSERRASALHQGELRCFPLGSNLADLPILERVAAVASLFVTRAAMRLSLQTPDSLDAWLRYQFGTHLANSHYIPYAEKIWKIHSSNLSIPWVENIIPRLELGSFFSNHCSHRGHYVYHPVNGGIQALVDALAAGVRGHLHLLTPVAAVEKHAHGYLVNGQSFDTVISTIPLPTLASVCRDLDTSLVSATQQLRFLSLATLCIATDEPPRFSPSWVYIPDQAVSPVNRISCMNHLGAAPDHPESASLVAEITFPGNSQIRLTEELGRNAIRSLSRLRLLDESAVRFVELRLMPHAYILGDHHYLANHSSIVNGIRSYGIHLLGRFAEFEQLNIDAILRRAARVAQQITDSR